MSNAKMDSQRDDTQKNTSQSPSGEASKVSQGESQGQFRVASNKPEPKKSSWLRRTCYTLAALLLPVFLAAGYVAYDAWKFLYVAPEKPGREMSIVIEPGTSFERVTSELYKMKAISSPWRFKLLAQYKQKLYALKAGEFAVNSGWTPRVLLENLVIGKPLLYRLTLREGLTWWESAKVIEEAGFAKASDFAQVIRDRRFLDKHGIPFNSAEGFLFPETYMLRKPRKLGRAEAEAVADLLVTTFWSKAGPLILMQSGVLPQEKAESGTVQQVQQVQQAQQGKQGKQGQGTQQGLPNLAIQTGAKGVAEGKTGEDSRTPTLLLLAQAGPNGQVVDAVGKPVTNSQVAGNAMAGNVTGRISASPTLVFVAPKGGQGDNLSESTMSRLKLPPQELRRLIIMASLVEKETAVSHERAVVSGVYHNRVKKNMLLQCDPTIIYGVGPSFNGGITRSQLNDPRNRYNTYKHPGLPPGPICSPGLAAIEAAVKPGEHDYLYFVATGNSDGSHTFSRNLQDHNKAVQVYRRSGH